MISIIYGKKGTGKTKQIIEAANECVSSGNCVFITENDKYIFNLKHDIRFINGKEYDICTELGLIGFIRGLIAGDGDIKNFFIDGATRLCCKEINEMEEFYKKLNDIATKRDIHITLTVSMSKDELPDFISSYCK